MKLILVTISLLATSLLFWYCKSPKHTLDALPEQQLRWGSGGGFTGKETSFTMLENGQIFQFVGVSGEKTEIKATKAKTAKGLFGAVISLELDKIDFDKPGNMYYFIETKGKETAHKITWGDDNTPVDQKVKDFYKVLQQLTKVTE
jgi:hypothetical protein